MTTPEQPGHTAQQLQAVNDAAREAIAKTPNTRNPLLAANYPAIKGQNLRRFGWDIDTGHSSPRGMVFPIGSFGHTGFTGTMLCMDPGSDTYVILFANAIHLRGSPPMSNLQDEAATAAAQALRLYSS
jgi:CubicO group peptidase (beta-lactamase class C family)